MIVAARTIPETQVKVGPIRDEHVYELFYTALPLGAFTPADVVALYLHRGAFETVLADEDQEQEPDRWCSHTAWGQEFWLILAQWTWNFRLELGHAFHPTPIPASRPIVWGDWQRCFHRREVVKLLRHQRVDVEFAEPDPPIQSQPIRLVSRTERAHWRLSWAERLARNVRPKTAPDVSIKLFGIPDAFATSLGLRSA